MQTPPKVLVVDQSLRSHVGHHLEYSLAVRNALRRAGFESEIFAHSKCLPELAEQENLTCLFHEAWTEKQKVATAQVMFWGILRLIGVNLSDIVKPGSFAADLRKMIDLGSLGRRDHVIIHTLNFAQLLQALQVFGKDDSPTLHVVLRQDPGESARGGLKSALLGIVFSAARKTSRVRFYSDTTALSTEFSRISKIRFETLPVLFEHELFIGPARTRDSRFVVTYLGDGRIEKGYHLLPQIITSTIKQNSNIVFSIQSYVAPHSANDPVVISSQKKLRELRANHPDNIFLHEEPLERSAYVTLLLESDAVLVPYDPVAYRFRSSGVLAQGSVAGKFLIYPSGTSLSTQAAPVLSNEYNDVLEIPSILLRLTTSEVCESTKEKAAQEFRAAHSPSAFVNALNLQN